tara:strand:- start:306 stop:983 length:678 start_codon:yes stop_codon:yes gene_type:complete
MTKKFSKKDAEYSDKPKSALPKKPGEPDQYANHNYENREVRPDGSTVYYYENGVKAIHHPPQKTSAGYHKTAAKHHLDETKSSIDSSKYKKALSHLRALSGHSQALDKFKEDSGTDVEKLVKEFAGTVAVASDPAVFTRTYGGNNKKGKSGVKKLDDYLKKELEHKKAMVSLVKDVQKELKNDDIIKKSDFIPELDETVQILKDDSIDFFEFAKEYNHEENTSDG